MPTSTALLMAACVGCLPASQPSTPACSVELRSPHVAHPDLTALDQLAHPVSIGSSSMNSITSDCAVRPIAPDRLTAVDWSHAVPSASSTAAKPVLLMGSQGKTVLQLQTRLKQLGYPVGAIDGVYGIRTRSAVRKFQQSQYLKPDGVVGQQTWVALQQPIASKPQIRTELPSKKLPVQSVVGSGKNAATPAPPARIETATPSRTIRIKGSPLWSEGYGWFVVWGVVQGIGWLVILRDARRQKRTIEAPSRVRSKASVEPIKPIVEQLLLVKDAEEMVVAFAPGDLDDLDEYYTYTLVEDEEGLFVMQNHELRVQMHRLAGQKASEKTVTLRCTNHKGESSERSLNVQVQKAPQPAYAV